MAKNINFEVQIMQGGRWTIHARFPSTQREQAIEEAKQVEAQKIGGGVRVIRDVYDSEAGTSSEFTIYKSGSGAGGSASSGGGGGGGGGGGSSFMDIDDDDDDDFPDDDSFIDDPEERQRIKQKRKQRAKAERSESGTQTSLTGIVVKLLFILLGSTLLSVGAVFGANILLEGANIFGVKMRGAALENFLILLFFLVFITTAIIFSTQAFKGKKLKERSPRKQRPARAPARPARQRPAPQPAPQESLSVGGDGMDELRAEVAQLKAELPESEDEEPSPEPEAEPEPETKEEAEEPEKQEETAPKPPDEADADAPMSPHDQKQKSYMMDFMGEALKGAGKDGESMSNFDKFGVSLYVAGASEALSQKRELSEDARAKIIADGVQTMGFKKSHAKSFAEKYEEYLVQDPTYMQMFQAGRNAMNTYFTDNTHAGKHMASAIQEWNKPKKKEEELGPVTVLFTDLAGSTAMTQALGDAGAQQVVRAHNRIVREALSQWAGKEVKHTGDGIMASFVKTSDSLDAAIQMQRESAKERERNPDLPLHLKIGINSGEPISEDNDLFGSTVQMSARIVDKAQADEIFVSEIVRGICAGKTYKFENRGTYPMKGFDTDPTLYEVVWKED